MQNFFQPIEGKKSIAEHVSIILSYQHTGLLDRKKAIDVYKTFNFTHADYNIIMNTTAAVTNSLIQIDLAPDNVIIENLKKQALWAMGEEYLRNSDIKI